MRGDFSDRLVGEEHFALRSAVSSRKVLRSREHHEGDAGLFDIWSDRIVDLSHQRSERPLLLIADIPQNRPVAKGEISIVKIGAVAKIRYGVQMFLATKRRDGSALENVSAKDWFTDRLRPRSVRRACGGGCLN